VRCVESKKNLRKASNNFLSEKKIFIFAGLIVDPAFSGLKRVVSSPGFHPRIAFFSVCRRKPLNPAEKRFSPAGRKPNSAPASMA
jgi:hypothetical protein